MATKKSSTTTTINSNSLEFFCRNSLFLNDEDKKFIHQQITNTAEFVDRICNPFPVSVFLYGSLARGEPACGREPDGHRFMGSDLDLIMVCKPEHRLLAEQLAGYINNQLPDLGLAARTDPNPGAKFVKVEDLNEVKAMRGFAATTMAMAIKHPLYGGLEVDPPKRGKIDGFMLLDQVASRLVQVTKAAACEPLPRYHGHRDPKMNWHYHDLYHKLRFGLDCCRVALGPDAEDHSYREVFQHREQPEIKRLFLPLDVTCLIKARERFGEVEPPIFDLATIIGKTLDIFVDQHQPGALHAFLQRLHWPQHLYQMAILLSFAGKKTTFAGAECDEALADLIERLAEIFDIKVNQSNLLKVLVDGSSQYNAFREVYNHGRMNSLLRSFIETCQQNA